jgi:hypothetical protein
MFNIFNSSCTDSDSTELFDFSSSGVLKHPTTSMGADLPLLILQVSYTLWHVPPDG